MKRLSMRLTSDGVFRALGSAAGDLAELFAICIFIGAIGVWGRVLAVH